MSEFFVSTATSTLDAPTGIPLYLRRANGGYLVTDAIGLRHGWSNTILYALEEWAGHVEYLCSDDPANLGSALRRERKSYRDVLGYDEQNTERERDG